MAKWNDRLDKVSGLPILSIPFYDETVDVVPTLDEYVYGGMAIMLWTVGDDEPWSTLTVNLGVGTDKAQTIDTNNNNYGPICEYLESVGVGRLNGRVVRSGFCTYPMMEFDEEFLAAIRHE